MRNSTVPVRINHLTHMICIYLNCVAVVAYKCKKHTFLQVKTIWCKPKARKTYLCDFGKRHSTWWHEVMNSFSMLMLRNYAKWWPSNQFGLTYLILQKHIPKKNNNRTYHSKVDIYVAMFEAQCPGIRSLQVILSLHNRMTKSQHNHLKTNKFWRLHKVHKHVLLDTFKHCLICTFASNNAQWIQTFSSFMCTWVVNHLYITYRWTW